MHTHPSPACKRNPLAAALALCLLTPGAYAACSDTAASASATAGSNNCVANGTSYTAATSALLANQAGSVLTVQNNVVANPSAVGTSNGYGVVSASGTTATLHALGSVTVHQAGAANSYGIAAGPVNPSGTGTVQIDGAVNVTMYPGSGATRRGVMSNGAGSKVTIKGFTTIGASGATPTSRAHRGLSAEGGGELNYVGASIDLRGHSGTSGTRSVTTGSILHGTGNTEVWVDGAGSDGLLGAGTATTTIDGWLKVHAGVGSNSAINFSGSSTLTIGPNSVLENPTGVAVRLSSTSPEPFAAGTGLQVTAATGFNYSGAITPTTTLTNATVNATTVWNADTGAKPAFVANGGTYTGTSSQDATSALGITLQNSAVWNLTGDSTFNTLTLNSGGTLSSPNASRTATGTVANTAGVVDLHGTSPQTGDQLTVAGPYSGGGTLQLDTALGNGASPTDKLLVTGAVSGTPTKIAINNLNGVGDLTGAPGILVVEVQGASPADAFALAAPVSAGGYNYTLVQVGPNWYLQSQKVVAPITATVQAALTGADATAQAQLNGKTMAYTLTCTPDAATPAAGTLSFNGTATPTVTPGSHTTTASSTCNATVNPADLPALPTGYSWNAPTVTPGGSPAAPTFSINLSMTGPTVQPPIVGQAAPVPGLGAWGLAGLMALLAGLGWARTGRGRQPG